MKLFIRIITIYYYYCNSCCCCCCRRRRHWWRSSLCLAPFFFYPKKGSWPSYCQISSDLDKILHTHTPIVVRNTLVGRLRPRSARGRLRAKPERLRFCIVLVTNPNSCIETTDRRDFGGKPSKWCWGRVLSWKIRNFLYSGRSQIQKKHFRF